tara:strand:- start:489 stop:770 length:282 start_codon:yes stop_codon:yes gene_type:complete
MALTERTEDDKIEIVTDVKILQVRTATVIEKDGKELTRQFSRRCIYPGDIDGSNNWIDTDMSKESTELQQLSAAVWTQAVKDKHKANLIAAKG